MLREHPSRSGIRKLGLSQERCFYLPWASRASAALSMATRAL